MYIINFIILLIITLNYLSSNLILANNKLLNIPIENANIKINQTSNYISNIKKLSLSKYNYNNSKINLVIEQAKSYIGTSYTYGGSTRDGIDCSALVKNVYSIININLNRISANQALQGKIISLNEAKKGDLLFFSHQGNSISHVGIIEHVSHKNKKIFFIHSASSKGVMISSLNDIYWRKKYKKTIRIIK